MAIDLARAKSLFLAAADLVDPAERAAYLDRACGTEVQLRARVEALLRVSDASPLPESGPAENLANSASAALAATCAEPPAPDKQAGTVIAGKYTLVEGIGEGGMGSVWRARQSEPVNRLVAVKLIKAGMDSKQVLARFDAERQALALMDHPNIAKVLDGGLHEHRPFFVMELVKGVPITDYCDARKLTPKERLELFVPVCQAIQHAHQKGIIHRDIKPRNVLVALYDDQPVVKVIDFGVAKATGGTLTAHTLDTGIGAVVGTPQYMSPEQATFNNPDIDTRSDVYALGVLLYELLTGSPPFASREIEQRGLLEMLRVVREEEPPRPSTRLTTTATLPTLAAKRGTEPNKLTSLLRNELDWIVMRALEKDRTRRYETATDFAADVRRYLDGEPVLAHPPSAVYRLRKFVTRYKGQVLAASVAVAALLAGVIALGISTWLISQEQRKTAAALRNEQQARRERAQAWMDGLLKANPQAVPEILRGLDPSQEEVMRRLRDLWEQADQPGNRGAKLRAGLALLPDDPTVTDRLADWMLQSDPSEFLLVRHALRPHGDELKRRLWAQLTDPRAPAELRFRVACALAAYDPDDLRWAEQGRVVTARLVTENPLVLPLWIEAFRPVRAWLLGPLADIFRDSQRSMAVRQLTTALLADYAADQPKRLAELIRAGENWQINELLSKLPAQAGSVIGPLRAELASLEQFDAVRPAVLGALAYQVPGIAEQLKEGRARQQARVAAALLRLGQGDAVWPLLRHRSEPELRSQLLSRLAPVGVDPGALIRRLEVEPDVSARRALILALGDYGPEQLPVPVRQPLVAMLLRWYRDDPDPGIHGAIDWLLRPAREGPVARPLDWGQAEALGQIDAELALESRRGQLGALLAAGPRGPLETLAAWYMPPDKSGERRWYVTSEGQTLTIVPGPVEFLMGSPETEDDRRSIELLHRHRIGRSFAIATKLVTVRQFEEFHSVYPKVAHSYLKRYSPEPDCPMTHVIWYDAAEYCRWLSEREGVAEDQMVFPPVAVIDECRRNGTAIKLPSNYLARTGYRLPTEAEWEYACRAGAVTKRYYGFSEELLARYAWCMVNSQNRTWPVGQKRPNDLGLFDMQGGIWVWCQQGPDWQYPPLGGGKVTEDEADNREITEHTDISVRGGSFVNFPPDIRAAFRPDSRPSYQLYIYGLRVVRTCP